MTVISGDLKGIILSMRINDAMLDNFFLSAKALIQKEDSSQRLIKEETELFLGYKLKGYDKYYFFFFSVMQGQCLFTYRTNPSDEKQHRVIMTIEKAGVVESIITGLIHNEEVVIIDEDISFLKKRGVKNKPKRIKKKVTKSASRESDLTILIKHLRSTRVHPNIGTIDVSLVENIDHTEDYLAFADDLADAIYGYYDSHIKITDRQKDIVFRRFGVAGYQPQTLKEIGASYDVTRERIRQILKKSLYGFKNPSAFSRILLVLSSVRSDDLVKYLYFGVYEVYGGNLLKYILDNLPRGDEIGAAINTLKADVLKAAKDEASKQKSHQTNLLRGSRFMSSLSRPSIMESQRAEAEFSALKVARRVNPGNNIGVFYSKKSPEPLEYESSLEFRVLVKLENNPFVKRVKTQSLSILRDNTLGRYYFPDIQILTVDDEIYIIEVKPLDDMVIPENIEKYNSLKDYCLTMGYGYAMIDERGNTFESVVNHYVPNEKKVAILKALESQKRLRYQDIKGLQIKHTISKIDLLKIVYDNADRLDYLSRPLSIKDKVAPVVGL